MAISALQNIREAQRARGTASILAIGTATPVNCYNQSDFPDFYFRITNCDHMTELKDKFKRICEKSAIKKRYMFLSEEILEKNPSLNPNEAPSVHVRQETLAAEVPQLGKAAALEAIKEWGQPISKITHLVVATSSSGLLLAPCVDLHLMKLLGLGPSVRRHMIYNHACFAGGTALRLAKDLVENSAGARALVVCVDSMAAAFSAPSPAMIGMLVGHAIFGDGAAAAIVGAVSSDDEADIAATERPLFRMVWAAQTLVPDSETAIVGQWRETGIVYSLSQKVPLYIGSNIKNIVKEAFAAFGISDWNSLFYAVHPGGRAVLDQVEEKLGLGAEKLRASRHVLSEYANMWGPTVLFVLDEMRRNAKEEQKATTGDGLEWGVLMTFGPGLTVETIVLRSEVAA